MSRTPRPKPRRKAGRPRAAKAFNRAGKNLSAARMLKLERAKTGLKRIFGQG